MSRPCIPRNVWEGVLWQQGDEKQDEDGIAEEG